MGDARPVSAPNTGPDPRTAYGMPATGSSGAPVSRPARPVDVRDLDPAPVRRPSAETGGGIRTMSGGGDGTAGGVRTTDETAAEKADGVGSSRDIDGDRGVDYLVHHPSWPAAETLAVDDGHFMGPGTAWHELAAVADQPAATGVTDADARLLLLFPTLGDTSLPDDAAPRLTAALDALTAIEEPAEVAGMLLEHQGQWEPADWRRRDGVWINDGGHSYRNPANPFALPGGRLREISAALNGERLHPGEHGATGTP
ncbi:hypothetical protein ACWEGS_19730 [Streptomyces sp. NPDC004822]